MQNENKYKYFLRNQFLLLVSILDEVLMFRKQLEMSGLGTKFFSMLLGNGKI